MANTREQPQKKGFPHLLAGVLFDKVKQADNFGSPVLNLPYEV